MKVYEGGRGKYHKKRKNRVSPVLLIAGLIVMVLLIIYIYLYNAYRITSIVVEGNEYYTQEEIEKVVMKGVYANNSLYHKLFCKITKSSSLPFLDEIEVTYPNHHTVNIKVFEKVLAGCVPYMGGYVYFDKDGIVAQITAEYTGQVPIIEGITFDSVVMDDKLPVEDSSVFRTIMNLTKLLDKNVYEKYAIRVDKIQLKTNYGIIIMFGNIRVALGEPVFLEEKIMNLGKILPKLEGESGILRMENYFDTSQEITFEKD